MWRGRGGRLSRTDGIFGKLTFAYWCVRNRSSSIRSLSDHWFVRSGCRCRIAAYISRVQHVVVVVVVYGCLTWRVSTAAQISFEAIQQEMLVRGSRIYFAEKLKRPWVSGNIIEVLPNILLHT